LLCSVSGDVGRSSTRLPALSVGTASATGRREAGFCSCTASSPRRAPWADWRLARSGYSAHRVDLGGLLGRFNTLPVETLAQVVADRVEQLARNYLCERIELVGHSEGDLIGRYYVQKLSGAEDH
jgi:hypothetical protein